MSTGALIIDEYNADSEIAFSNYLESDEYKEDEAFMFHTTSNKKNIEFKGPIKTIKNMCKYANPDITRSTFTYTDINTNSENYINCTNNKNNIILFHEYYPPNLKGYINAGNYRVNFYTEQNLKDFISLSGYNLIIDSKDTLELIDFRSVSADNPSGIISTKFKITFELSDKAIKTYNKKISIF